MDYEKRKKQMREYIRKREEKFLSRHKGDEPVVHHPEPEKINKGKTYKEYLEEAGIKSPKPWGGSRHN
jgi:hypothetical protein